jgi:hypothetical protein
MFVRFQSTADLLEQPIRTQVIVHVRRGQTYKPRLPGPGSRVPRPTAHPLSRDDRDGPTITARPSGSKEACAHVDGRACVEHQTILETPEPLLLIYVTTTTRGLATSAIRCTYGTVNLGPGQSGHYECYGPCTRIFC